MDNAPVAVQPHSLLDERVASRLAIGWVVLVVLVDVLSGPDIVLVGLLIVAPLLSGLTAEPRVARRVGAACVVIAASAWAWNDTWGSWTFWVPLSVVTAGSLFAALMASDRRRLLRDERRMAVLAEVAHIGHGDATVAEIGDRVASILVPGIVDLAVVDLVDADGGLQRLAGALNGDPAVLAAVMARTPSTGPGSATAAAEPALQHLPAIDGEVLRRIAHGDEDLAVLQRLALDSAVLVPLVARDRPIGVLTLATRAPSPPIQDGADVAYAEVLAGRVALALDNTLLSQELSSTERRLEAILVNIDAAVMVRHVDGRLVFANQAAADLLGLPDPEAVTSHPSSSLMARFDVYAEDGSPVALGDLPGTRLLSGDPDPPPLIVRNVDKSTGRERWLLNRASAVRGSDGAVVMAVNLIEDVTGTKRGEVGQRLLAETARQVAEAADLDRTLQAIADAAVPGLADWAGVDLLDPRGRIVTVAVAHRDPEKVRLGWELRTRWPVPSDEPEGLAAVVRDGTRQLVERVTDEMLVASARDEEHLAMLRSVGLTSTMIVPVGTGERTLGALSFVSSTSRRFDERDLQLACDLGRQAGIFINNARLHAERAHIATTLQAGLLPDTLPAVSGWGVDVAYRAAGAANHVGGDFYDVVAFEGGWAALIGDVVGKGAEAAVLTSLARHTLAAIIESTGDAAHALTVLNRRLRERGDGASSLCTIAVVAVRDDVAAVLCAGHPLPLLLRDGVVLPVGAAGPMLGVIDDLDLTAEDVVLAPDDELVLYTDGVLDAVGERDRFGEDRLLRVAATLAGRGTGDLAAQLLAAVDDFARGDQIDDIAIVSLTRAGVPAELPAAWGGVPGTG